MIHHGIRQTRGMAKDDAEALQTDVMRFLAIICMCLMIVFSLVPSIPVNQAAGRPKILTGVTLERELPVREVKAHRMGKTIPELEQKRPLCAVADAEQRGFTLGFDSNEVLLQLLKKGTQVEFYIVSGTRSWKLTVEKSGSVAFSPFPSPVRIYQMDHHTVPQKILSAGRRVVAAFGSASVIYGVALSTDIAHRIDRLMQEKKGGDLVITSENKVILE